LITADDIRQRFQEADLQAITGGDESVITRAVNSARIWLQAALGARGMELNEENEVQREIIIKRTLYELYATLKTGKSQRLTGKKRNKCSLRCLVKLERVDLQLPS